jgi:hypothetical protein
LPTTTFTQPGSQEWAPHSRRTHTTCDLTVEETFTWESVAVLKLSRSGIQLALDFEVPGGSKAAVVLQKARCSSPLWRTLHVVDTFPAPGGGYIVEGRFTYELSDWDLQDLL